ncbi:MAG TPA: type IV pilus biogenesis/stability protein PilW [Steroidobacteraceae bacterium]|nr:type IV pilus biogenesis/stability protein PilW [Steroidobacteraceae bacterium]
MKSATLKLVAAILGICLAACAHNNSGFKKASPQVQAATNMQLAIEYMKLGQLANARDFIERALSEDPSNPDVQMTAGLVYERLLDPQRAERAYAAGYRLGKGDPNIQNTYAGFLCRTGKAVAGEKLFAEVARSPLYQTPEVALVNAGVCVRGTGDIVDAERYFNRALAIRPNMPEALLQLGNIAFDRGDAAQAREVVLRYLAVNPSTPELLWLGFRAERKLGDATAAAGYARRVQTEFPNSEQAQMMRSGINR